VTISDLATHPFAYVTVNELADYWRITPARILTAIQAGELEAIEFGAGTCRIATRAAQEFEERARYKASPWPRGAWRDGKPWPK
jgi:hypothetical protein